MKITMLLPGKIKPTALASAQDEYIRRLKAFGVEVLEYKDEKVSSRTPDQTKQAEAERIFKLLKDGDYLIACDERGRAIKTMELAGLLKASRAGDAPLAGKRRFRAAAGRGRMIAFIAGHGRRGCAHGPAGRIVPGFHGGGRTPVSQ